MSCETCESKKKDIAIYHQLHDTLQNINIDIIKNTTLLNGTKKQSYSVEFHIASGKIVIDSSDNSVIIKFDILKNNIKLTLHNHEYELCSVLLCQINENIKYTAIVTLCYFCSNFKISKSLFLLNDKLAKQNKNQDLEPKYKNFTVHQKVYENIRIQLDMLHVQSIILRSKKDEIVSELKFLEYHILWFTYT